MSVVEKFMGIAFTLIALGLIVVNAGKFNTVVTTLGTSTDSLIGQLQAG